MVFEDLEPQKGELKPKDLTNWNIEELEQYIATVSYTHLRAHETR
mgnify:CR=1 FL=1